MINIDYSFKDVYLPVFTSNVKTNDGILKRIKTTPKDVYGKEIIRLNDCCDDIDVKKEIKTIMIEIKISHKALRVCENSMSAFVNLVNDVWDTAIRDAIKKLLNLLCDEIRKDCEIDCSNTQIKKALKQLSDDEFDEILLHQLCEWRFLENEDGSLAKTQGDFETYYLVKYCNFTMSKAVRDKIKELV